MCSRKKISLLRDCRAIVFIENKSGRGRRADKHRKIAETRKGTKTNRSGLAKRKCDFARGDPFTAIIAPRLQILERGCIDFSRAHTISMMLVCPA
ncbi:hypothetical protein AM571_CH00506 [Rhizobium etli 8C-3]|uniref:Uncharacterized protein n=1 Tax=Rhizobium etli 8C-3 TaxID=538025 RepID=A0A1L5NZS6_RHIET|nr:hypothetical protein AM571_CH00506 [Rhizobium etli 8C-3]